MRILTKHAPLLGAGAALTGGRDLHDRQRVALAEAQRVPGVGSADDVRQVVGAYLQQMVADETAAIPGPMSDLLALLDDAQAVAFERAAAAGTGAAGSDWATIAHAIGGVRTAAETAERTYDDGDPR